MVLADGDASKLYSQKLLNLYEFFALLNQRAKEHRKNNSSMKTGARHSDNFTRMARKPTA